MKNAVLADQVAPLLEDLAALYEDLHQHPELSFQEERTAGIAAQRLRDLGYEVTEGVGRTGVVAVLDNGPGPTLLIRADMDALPVTEETGLPYASTQTGVDPDGATVGVTHACGHDMHVTWLIGAAAVLAEDRDSWSGRLMFVVQPAEELAEGADAMIADGLFERFGKPDVCLGQHLAPAPAGWILYRGGPTMAATDSVKLTLHGRGGHGSTPEMTVDPAILAASTIMKLQTITSREKAAADLAVVTVGTVRVGTKENVISDRAELGINIRTFSERVRQDVLASIERIAHGESHSCGSPRDPDIETIHAFPALVNDPEATARVSAVFTEHFGEGRCMEGPQALGSEDFGAFATAAGCPSVFWFVGGHDADHWLQAFAANRLAEEVPYNHSPKFAPVQDPTIRTGVETLVLAALEWAGKSA
ncbi:MAG: amidohydrolase [Acidimicrobiales bacterium]|nr:amidohydrolase [Acidimicrobiales bacterium]